MDNKSLTYLMLASLMVFASAMNLQARENQSADADRQGVQAHGKFEPFSAQNFRRGEQLAQLERALD